MCKAAPVPGETKVWQYIALTRTRLLEKSGDTQRDAQSSKIHYPCLSFFLGFVWSAEQVRKFKVTSACHRKLYLLDCPGIVPPSPSDFEADCAKAWET